MSDATRLVVVCGLPGAGKTTVAEAVTDRLDATVLRTDVVRKELFSDPEYTSEESKRAYDAVFDRASATLADDTSVVLDGTFRRAARRDRARSVAAAADVPFDFLRVTCDESTAKARIRSREGDASDADVAVYELFREEFEPIDDPLVVDNSGDLDATLARVRELF
jgi:predicted kinase